MLCSFIVLFMLFVFMLVCFVGLEGLLRSALAARVRLSAQGSALRCFFSGPAVS